MQGQKHSVRSQARFYEQVKYQTDDTESGGDKKPVAGKNIMKRMLNRKIIVPVVIITQFETFDDDKISLDSLNAEFQEGLKIYGREQFFMEMMIGVWN